MKKDLAVKKIAEENDIRVDDNDIKGYAASVSEEASVQIGQKHSSRADKI